MCNRSAVAAWAEADWLGRGQAAALRHLSKLIIAHMISIDSRRGIRHIPDRGIYFRPPEAKGLLVCHILGGADQESPAPAKAGQEQALRFPGCLGDNIHLPTRQTSLQSIGKRSRWNFGISHQTRLGFQQLATPDPGLAMGSRTIYRRAKAVIHII